MDKSIKTGIFSEESVLPPVLQSAPQFIWSGYVEQETAPLLNAAKSYRSENNRGSILFWDTLKNCMQALIIDKFLDIYVLDRMYSEIDNRTECIENFSIKVLYCRKAKNEELIGLIKDTAKQKKGNAEFKCVPEYKWFVHDRFAFIDGILWHFGADIGGGHKDINAYSLGWANTNFDCLFDSLWREASL